MATGIPVVEIWGMGIELALGLKAKGQSYGTYTVET